MADPVWGTANKDRRLDWNNDPEWLEYIATLEPVIGAIAAKSTIDEALRDDLAQEARMSLLLVRPEKIKGNRSAYVRNVIRNTMYSYLQSYNTGSWAHGRKEMRTVNGERVKVSLPARFSSLCHLMEQGMEVDQNGNRSWEMLEEFDVGE